MWEIQSHSIWHLTETAGARWFRQDESSALELSTDRVTVSQLEALFPFAVNLNLPALCE